MTTKPFPDIAINGGSVIFSPAGTFTEEGTGRLVEYDEKIKIDYMGKIYRIPPAAAAALYEAIRNNKDLAAYIGVKSGILG